MRINQCNICESTTGLLGINLAQTRGNERKRDLVEDVDKAQCHICLKCWNFIVKQEAAISAKHQPCTKRRSETKHA